MAMDFTQTAMRPLPLSAGVRPQELLHRWPREVPFAGVCSCRMHPAHSRWSVFGQPIGFLDLSPRPQWYGNPPPMALDLDHGPIAALRSALEHREPAGGAWFLVLSYELGAALEQAVGAGRPPSSTWGFGTLAWCPSVIVHDGQEQQWYATGDEGPRSNVAALLAACTDPLPPAQCDTPVRTTMTHGAYLAAVRRILDLISAGDIFQANMTYQQCFDFSGSVRTLATAAMNTAQPWYGAHIELPHGRSVTSLSPELYVEYDAHTNAVRSRPIKGTASADQDPETLRRSEKDASELHMIIDLMRNDLGRVCSFGSISVPGGRVIETHPTVHHGVATVEGRVRNDCSRFDIINATFPPGSITGAPKIRAMQILDELESGPRGPYCGGIGLCMNGNMQLNVAIRTLAASGTRAPGRWDLLDGEVRYGVGGGIVADSVPELEARECRVKGRVLERTLDALAADTSSVVRHSDV